MLRYRSIGIKIFHIRKEHLAKIRIEGRPIIHLHVDIMPISRRPRGAFVSVPRSLQICGVCSRTGGSNQQISAEGEIHFFQIAVGLSVLIILNENIRRNPRNLSAEIDHRTFDQRFIIRRMSLQKLLIGIFHGTF